MPIRTWRRACPRSQNPSTIKARPQAQPRKNHHRPAWSPVITDFSASTPNPPATAPPAAIAAEPSSTAAQRPPARSVDRPEPTTVSRGVAGCSWCVTTTVHLRQPTPPSGARWDHPMCLMLLVLNPVRQRERPTRGCAPRHRGVTAIRSTGSGTRPSLVPLRGSSERVRGTDDQLSTDHAPILWFFDVPPARDKPASVRSCWPVEFDVLSLVSALGLRLRANAEPAQDFAGWSFRSTVRAWFVAWLAMALSMAAAGLARVAPLIAGGRSTWWTQVVHHFGGAPQRARSAPPAATWAPRRHDHRAAVAAHASSRGADQSLSRAGTGHVAVRALRGFATLG